VDLCPRRVQVDHAVAHLGELCGADHAVVSAVTGACTEITSQRSKSSSSVLEASGGVGS